MDEHEEGKVGQEIEQVQGRNALQLPFHGGLQLQAHPAGLQLQQQLLWADEASTAGGVPSLLVQKEQEQLLRGSGQQSVKRDGGLTPRRRALLCAAVCFCAPGGVGGGASDYPDLFPGV